MSSSTDRVQIGEFAKLAGTNLRTLRYYEELGLLTPAPRDDGGFRFYDRDQLERVAAIKRLQDLGLSLREVASALAIGDTTGCAQAVVERLCPAIDRQLALTQAKVEKLEQELADLRAARQRVVEMCGRCDRTLALHTCDPCPRDHQPLPAVLKALLG